MEIVLPDSFLELQIKLWHKESEASQRLEAIPGVGPITASAIVATVGNATEFKDSRQLAVWLGVSTQAAFKRSQTVIARYQQTRRYLSSHPADPRSTSSHPLCREEGRARKLAVQADNTAQ